MGICFTKELRPGLESYYQDNPENKRLIAIPFQVIMITPACITGSIPEVRQVLGCCLQLVACPGKWVGNARERVGDPSQGVSAENVRMKELAVSFYREAAT